MAVHHFLNYVAIVQRAGEVKTQSVVLTRLLPLVFTIDARIGFIATDPRVGSQLGQNPVHFWG